MLVNEWTRRRTAAVASAVAVVALLSACGRGGSGGGGSVSGDTAARVGDARVTRDKVLGAVDRGLAGKTTLTRKVLTQEHLTTQVKLALYAAEAKKLGVTLTAEELKATRDVFEEQTKQEGGLVKAAETSGIAAVDLDDIIEMVTFERVIGDRLVKDAPVTDAELETLRAASKDFPQFVDQAHAAHILVKDETLAKQLLAQIKGGADFAALAAKNSIDTGSKDQGGDLGTKPKGTYVPPFEAALYAAKAGDVVGPVKSEFGYHIIKVLQFFTAAEVKERVRTSPAAAGAVSRLRLKEVVTSGPAVTINPRFGRWDPAKLSVVAVEGDKDDPSAPSAGPSLGAPADPGAPADQGTSPEPTPSQQ